MSHLIIAEKEELITRDLIIGILDSLTAETEGTNGVFIIFHFKKYNEIKDILVDDDWLNDKLKEALGTDISTHYEKSDKVHVTFTNIFTDEKTVHIQPISFGGIIDYRRYQVPTFYSYTGENNMFKPANKIPYGKI